MIGKAFICGSLLAVSFNTFAANTERGVTACYSEKALGEYVTARANKDIRSQEWLLAGACMVVPKKARIQIVNSENGVSKIRPRIGRREVTLWTKTKFLSR